MIKLIYHFAILLIIIINILYANPLEPLVNPLSYKQEQSYIISAPSGDDQPFDPLTENTEGIIVNVEEGESNTLIVTPESPSAIEETVSESLERISLEERIEQQVVQSQLEQFGYDIFNNEAHPLLPISYIPVPPDYIIGPGDTLIIQLYGKSNVEYSLVVQREGNLLIPELGPIPVSGLTFEEMKKLIYGRLKTQKFGVEAAITMGEIRTIRVLLVGEVIQPGSYTINGLTTLLQFLISSQGIKRSGSLRNITVKRQGKIINIFDVYDLLLKGNTDGDIPLRHGDTIFIPTIADTVSIAGEVTRPAIYELKQEKTIAQVLALSGGLLPTAKSGKVHIERIIGNQGRTLIDIDINSRKSLATFIENGDIIRVFPVPRQMNDVILLSGPVIQPGGYQYQPGMRISNILPNLNMLLAEADQKIALLRRELPNSKKVIVRYINLYQAIYKKNPQYNYKLAPRDQIIIFSLNQSRAKQTQSVVDTIKTQAEPGITPPAIITILGQTRYTGVFPLENKTKLLDALEFAGGILEKADRHYGLIVRKQFPEDSITFISFDLEKALYDINSPENIILFPEDTIYILPEDKNRTALFSNAIDQLLQQTPYNKASKVVFVEGSIRIPGRYPMEPGMRIDDLLRAGGGLIEQSYGLQAEVTRYLLEEGEMRVAEHIDINLASVLEGNIQHNIILHPHDRLVLHQKPQWNHLAKVTLTGEVKFPGVYPIDKQETLCEVLQRAGGLTDHAYPFGSVFTRNTVKQEQQFALDRIREDMDDLLAQIHLSPSVDNADKMPAGELKHRILQTIRTLEKAKASGRMVIDLEGAMQCNPKVNIRLEDGDTLFVPTFKYQVHVLGEVYYATSHTYRPGLTSQDYIDLSGGTTVLARKYHAYVVQANGEVFSVRGGDWSGQGRSVTVTPGATIYVPINVDRINNREAWQAWTEIAYQLAVSTASLRFIFGGL